MKVYQRMMYVGLGGTGLQIGADIEKSLRQGLTGPDGTNLLVKGGPFSSLQPFELPGFVRFVYADFDRTDLGSRHLRRAAHRVGHHLGLPLQLRLRCRMLPPAAAAPRHPLGARREGSVR